MNWLTFGLLVSIVFVLNYFQQIKMALKDHGHDVELLTGWLTDYRKFKELAASEKDEWRSIKYQGILNGLHLALAGLVVIGAILAFGN